ncbi:MAG: twin-arginine translocation signal domain-containing protein, partial [Kiritimatiellae bacterium]|nr:twin-arginine translocation signal domain-containing protein [Kiritimatiellia bacterium]
MPRCAILRRDFLKGAAAFGVALTVLVVMVQLVS